MSELRLIVQGVAYGGWKSVRVRLSLESLAGSFELDVSDRWAGQTVTWPIREEDACRIEIDGVTVMDGYVDARRVAISATDRSLTYSGRDRAAAMVDGSALLEKWSFRGVSLPELARILAAPYGISVSVQPGLESRVLAPLSRKTITVSPGESSFAVLEAAARAAGVLVVSDGQGGIRLTSGGTERATTAIVEGENLLEASVTYDAAERFARYVVATQVGGSDSAYGTATRIQAEAHDEGVARQERVLLIRPEKGLGADYARRRADWEARVRAARAERVSVAVLGWRQPSGPLWPLNALVTVEAPSIGVRRELLVAGVEFSLDDAGELTRLELVRPDAFTPEPQAVVKASGGVSEIARVRL